MEWRRVEEHLMTVYFWLSGGIATHGEKRTVRVAVAGGGRRDKDNSLECVRWPSMEKMNQVGYEYSDIIIVIHYKYS
jgi:hypothetical protein